MGTRSVKFAKLKYEDFPIKLFFHLLSRPERVAHLFLGKKKWEHLKLRWDEDDDSMEADRLLEDQKKAAIPLIKAQRDITVLKWLRFTQSDVKKVFEELGLPWREDPEELIKSLQKSIRKNISQYENNLIQLQATLKQQKESDGASKFSIDDAIASLNLAGFTVVDPDKLTIGQFRAMNKAIEKNGERTRTA